MSSEECQRLPWDLVQGSTVIHTSRIQMPAGKHGAENALCRVCVCEEWLLFVSAVSDTLKR